MVCEISSLPKWSLQKCMEHFNLIDPLQMRVMHRINDFVILDEIMKKEHGAHLVEVDVVFDERTGQPMIGHNPGTKYNISLESYIERFLTYAPLRGLWLDFKEPRAAQSGMRYLSNLLQNGGTINQRLLADVPVLLVNADLLGAGTETAINVHDFVKWWRQYVPTAVVAVGLQYDLELVEGFQQFVFGAGATGPPSPETQNLLAILNEIPKRIVEYLALFHEAAVGENGVKFSTPPRLVLTLPMELALLPEQLAGIIQVSDTQLAGEIGATWLSFHEGLTEINDVMLRAVAELRLKHGLPVMMDIFLKNTDLWLKVREYAGV